MANEIKGELSKLLLEKEKWWSIRGNQAKVAGTLIAFATLLFGNELWKKMHGSDPTPPKPTPEVQSMITNFILVNLPSSYADVVVTIDGKPADVIDRTLSSQTLWVVTTEGQHQFHFQKGSVSRDISQFLSASQTNVTLSPFSN